MDQASARKVSVLLIAGTVGAGETAVAREVGDLLRPSRVAGGPKVACGVIDLDALSYVAAGPVEDRFNSNFVLENLKAIWPNYAPVASTILCSPATSAQGTRWRRTARPSPPQRLRSVASPHHRKRCRTVCVDASVASHESS
jgi:hypothetical protein